MSEMTMTETALDARLAAALVDDGGYGVRRQSKRPGQKPAHRWNFQLPGEAEPLLPGDPAIRVLAIELGYSKGEKYMGHPRGYTLSLMPMTLSASKYGLSESFTLFDTHGAKFLLKRTDRFSAKEFDALVRVLNPYAPALAEAWKSSKDDLRGVVAAVKSLAA